MKSHRHVTWITGLAGLACLLAAVDGASAQERPFMVEPRGEAPAPPAPPAPLACSGPITKVMDLAYEGVKTTTAVYGTNPGGGEGNQFDKVPVLTTRVQLAPNSCLDAHLSAIVGSKQTYGRSPLTLFQVTLTGTGASPMSISGHYRTPYGHTPPSPAVALEAEHDVGMFAANFFQRVGTGPNAVPPGVYKLDVWWAGAPQSAPGGAIGAAFVLKLYMR
jgi:hypothetical protein